MLLGWIQARVACRLRRMFDTSAAIPLTNFTGAQLGQTPSPNRAEPRRSALNCPKLPQPTCGFAKAAGQDAMPTSLAVRGSLHS